MGGAANTIPMATASIVPVNQNPRFRRSAEVGRRLAAFFADADRFVGMLLGWPKESGGRTPSLRANSSR